MENETPFAVDADEDARLRAASTASNANNLRARNPAGQVDKGVIQTHVHEETPLLSQWRVGRAGSTGDEDGVQLNTPWLGAKEVESKPWWRRPSIWWLIPPLLPFTLAFGGLAVPKINLILALICRDYLSDRASKDPNFTHVPVIFGGDNSQCQIPQVQSLVARFQLYFNLISGILSAVVSPRLGRLSDRYGRKMIIALATFGAIMGEVVNIVVAARPDQSSVNVLLISAFLDGMCGSFTTAMALIHSYAADCTPPERRNVAFGYFHGVLFSGVAAGPFLAGYLIKKTKNIISVFYTALGCHTFFFLMLVFIIPESLSMESRRIAREKHRAKLLDEDGGSKWLSLGDLNPFNLLKPLSILFPRGDRPGPLFPTGRGASSALRRNLILLAAIDTAVFGVAMGTVQVIIIYAEYMFDWGNYESSIFVSLVNTVRVINLLVILPAVTRIVRGPQSGQQPNTGSDMLDIVIIRLSILFDMAGYIGYATVRTGSLMTLSGMVAAIGGMGSPTLQSSLTKHVPPDRTGQLLGAMGLLHALARVIAPTIFNLIYSLTVGKFTQTVFVCLAAVFGLTFVMSWGIKPHVYMEASPRPSPEPPNDDEEENLVSQQ
ncbi:hypothetical protein VTN00DRAFT_1248 [Thermoascus crustaceus]|uniref:uncharacterized protein n=1 Tax=Thermoascus crustaceus TaxID=5088 RepID=UPI0037449A8B